MPTCRGAVGYQLGWGPRGLIAMIVILIVFAQLALLV